MVNAIQGYVIGKVAQSRADFQYFIPLSSANEDRPP